MKKFNELYESILNEGKSKKPIKAKITAKKISPDKLKSAICNVFNRNFPGQGIEMDKWGGIELKGIGGHTYINDEEFNEVYGILWTYSDYSGAYMADDNFTSTVEMELDQNRLDKTKIKSFKKDLADWKKEHNKNVY